MKVLALRLPPADTDRGFFFRLPMDVALQKALDDLRSIGARRLPSPAMVETAPDRMTWKGRTATGRSWELRKNARESYHCAY